MKALHVSMFCLGGLLAVATAVPLRGEAAKPTAKRKVTFASNIAPILYAKCAGCHHSGEVAPFSLTSYAEARDKAKTIEAAVTSKYMPPWQAISHGEFVNERVLTPQEIDDIKAWAEAGAPEGEVATEPKPPHFTPGWQGGQPDFVGKPAKTYTVSAEGDDIYRCFVIHTDFPTDKYVQTVELRPGNRKIVHHVLVYIDTKGQAAKRDGEDGAPGYTSFGGPGFVPSGALGGWAPGLAPQVLPSGTGMLLPKGADIVLQVHYHKNGKKEEDLTQIGLQFAKGTVDKEVRWRAVGNELISIPPGKKDYQVKAQMVLQNDITILDWIPHMHLLGHDMKVVATLPDGTVKPMVDVAPYDFNWQTRYTYKDAQKLPKGTKLSLVAHYDNSTDNIHNPNNPPKRVTFGEQTTDEMCYAFFSYTVDREHLSKGIKAPATGGQLEEAIDHIFTQFDANQDGYLDAGELAAVIKFYQAQTGGDAKMNPDTAAKFLIATYGKTKPGRLTKAEFTTLVQSLGQQRKAK